LTKKPEARRKVRREGLIPECTYERLQELVLGFRIVGACKHGVSYESVAKTLGKDETWVSRNAKFLMKVGLLVRERPKSYKLTEKGCEYAKALELGLEDEAKSILRSILSAYELSRWTCNLIKVKKSISRDELVRRIAARVDVPLKIHRFKGGINAFIDMLIDAGMLVSREDGRIEVAEAIKVSEQPITIEYKPSEEVISAENIELTEIRFRHIRIVLRPNLEDIEIAKKLLKTLEELVKAEKKEREVRRSDIASLMNFTSEGGKS